MAELVVGIVAAILVVLIVSRTVRLVPQARAGNVERLGRYLRTLQPGLNFVIPFVDRVRPLIDLREQVISFEPRPVITEDNLVVHIDTVLYVQVTDPRDAAYQIQNYIQAIEQLTVTTLRNVIGSMDLEKTLTSREHINSTLRGVLDDASGKWGIRVNRVELKAIDPPGSVKESMEKQMRADREKRAAILNAEGVRQSKILTAEGDKRSAVLNAEGDREAAVLRADGQSEAIDRVFQAVHRNNPDPKLLAYQYLQVLPELAKGDGNTFWVIPSEVTTALNSVTQAFGGALGSQQPDAPQGESTAQQGETSPGGTPSEAAAIAQARSGTDETAHREHPEIDDQPATSDLAADDVADSDVADSDIATTADTQEAALTDVSDTSDTSDTDAANGHDSTTRRTGDVAEL